MSDEAEKYVWVLTEDLPLVPHTGRSLREAIIDAVKLETEFSHIAHVYPADYDRLIMAKEIERLRGLLDAWLGLAREHLDTELAGRTFEALERTRK